MMRRIRIQLGILEMAALLTFAFIVEPPLGRLHAAQQDQPNQQNQQPSQNQDQTSTDQQQQKKKGGMFGGLKKITSGQSSQETASTASGGSKGISDGKKIGEMTPSAADRQQVTDMENYSVPQNDLKKFQDDGHLQPKQ